MTETTIEWVLEHYLDRVQALFDALDLNRVVLEVVKAAVGHGDWPAACRALLDYYRDGDSGKWLREKAVQHGNRGGEADLLLADIYTDMGRQYGDMLLAYGNGRSCSSNSRPVGWWSSELMRASKPLMMVSCSVPLLMLCRVSMPVV